MNLWVVCLALADHLDEEVDRSLNRIEVPFLLPFGYYHYTDHLGGGRYVEKQWLIIEWSN
jgi:hypothetical protein